MRVNIKKRKREGERDKEVACGDGEERGRESKI